MLPPGQSCCRQHHLPRSIWIGQIPSVRLQLLDNSVRLHKAPDSSVGQAVEWAEEWVKSRKIWFGTHPPTTTTTTCALAPWWKDGSSSRSKRTWYLSRPRETDLCWSFMASWNQHLTFCSPGGSDVTDNRLVVLLARRSWFPPVTSSSSASTTSSCIVA